MSQTSGERLKRVSIVEFRTAAPEYLKGAETIVVTNHGRAVGVYTPIDTEAVDERAVDETRASARSLLDQARADQTKHELETAERAARSRSVRPRGAGKALKGGGAAPVREGESGGVSESALPAATASGDSESVAITQESVGKVTSNVAKRSRARQRGRRDPFSDGAGGGKPATGAKAPTRATGNPTSSERSASAYPYPRASRVKPQPDEARKRTTSTWRSTDIPPAKPKRPSKRADG